MMKRYYLPELGYFTPETCESIAKHIKGASFMNLNVVWSGQAPNCTLAIDTDYEGTKEDIKNTFLHCMLSKFREVIKE